MRTWAGRLLAWAGLGVDRRRRPRRRPTAHSAAAPPKPDAPEPAPEPPPRDADPFAPFAGPLGVSVPPPAAEEIAPDAEDLALADRVLAHFRSNRPGPASAPSLALRVLNLVAAPSAEVGEMVRLISADAAMSAGVLTVANSVVYRGVDEIDTVRAAVVRLGLKEVARVAGAVSARSLFNPRLRAELAAHADQFTGLFRRALAVATAAAELSLQRAGMRSDRAYLGGMLFDVGKSIALRSLAAVAPEDGAGVHQGRVDRVLDLVHVEVGTECHREWNLPQYLTVIAARHHEVEVPASPEFVELHAVRLCGALLDIREPWLALRAAREIVQSARALGLSPAAVRSVDAGLRTATSRVAAAFGLEPG